VVGVDAGAAGGNDDGDGGDGDGDDGYGGDDDDDDGGEGSTNYTPLVKNSPPFLYPTHVFCPPSSLHDVYNICVGESEHILAIILVPRNGARKEEKHQQSFKKKQSILPAIIS
jgi:hypothetical protein